MVEEIWEAGLKLNSVTAIPNVTLVNAGFQMIWIQNHCCQFLIS